MRKARTLRHWRFVIRHFPARRFAVINFALRGIAAVAKCEVRSSKCECRSKERSHSSFEIHHSAFLGSEQADTFRCGLQPDFHPDYVLANPPFNDSDTALRVRAFLQTGGTMQVMAERQDNFRKDDDVRWQFGLPLGLNFNN